MNIKNEVFESKIGEVLKTLQEKEMPIVQSLRVIKLLKEIQAHSESYMEAKKKLLDKYGKPDEKGAYTFSEDKRMPFWEEFSALLKEEFKISDDLRIKLPSKMEMAPKDVLALEPFLNTEE